MSDKDNSNEGNVNSATADTSSFSSILASVQRMRQEHGVQTNEEPRRKLPQRHEPPLPQTPQTPREHKDTTVIPKKSLPITQFNSFNEPKISSNLSKPLQTANDKLQTPPTQMKKNSNTQHRQFEKQTFRAIQVSRSQTGNPLLEYLTPHPYEMNGRIKDVDYVINSHCIVLFLSLKYHKLHPEYIYNKLKKVGYKHEAMSRLLLVLVDVADFQDSLRELNKLCMFNDLNLILGWSNEQCGEYIKCLKSSESKISKKLITGTRTRDEDVLANEGEYLKRIVDVMKSVKGVNKNDAVALVSKFGTFKGVCCEADEDTLSDINGLGATKVERLLKVINDPFVYK